MNMDILTAVMRSLMLGTCLNRGKAGDIEGHLEMEALLTLITITPKGSDLECLPLAGEWNEHGTTYLHA
jgi:hypothetical protein